LYQLQRNHEGDLVLYRRLGQILGEVIPTSDYDSFDYWRPRTVDPNLVDSVQSSSTFHVVADFTRTRIGRRVTGKVVKPVVGLVARQVSKVTWLKYTTKGVTRFIPILGWGLLAYDLYNLGEDLEFY
jgi:hypothetical protein